MSSGTRPESARRNLKSRATSSRVSAPKSKAAVCGRTPLNQHPQSVTDLRVHRRQDVWPGVRAPDASKEVLFLILRQKMAKQRHDTCSAARAKRLMRIAQGWQVNMSDQVSGASLWFVGVEASGPDSCLATRCALGPRLLTDSRRWLRS